MSDGVHAVEPTRRQLVAGAAATLGGLGLLALPEMARAQTLAKEQIRNDPQTILNVAATAEVLATIVNTVGGEKDEDFFEGLKGDKEGEVTRRNIRAAAREELVHYDVLVSSAVGGKAITKRIWVPDAVFASAKNLLNTLEVGDQIFVNAYQLGILEFGYRGAGDLAVVASQFMGVEAVHRALARQSNGKLGNDRVFMKLDDKEEAPDAPNKGQEGFEDILGAVKQLEAAGFGFGKKGASPGKFYDFDQVRKRTPNDPDLNTFMPSPD
jgi:hypothetical protein